MDAESLNKKTVATLKALCKKMGVKCAGTKAQHIDALLMAEAAKEGIKEVKIPTKNPTKKSKSPVRGRSKSPKKPTKKVVKKSKSPARKSKSPKKPTKKVARKSKSPARGRSKSPKKSTKKSTKSKSPKKMSPEFIIEIPTTSPTKKKSPKPIKKSPVKGRKSPVKSTKKTATKKSPVKKAKTCVDKEDPLLCGEDQICSAPSGRCIKDTKVNRHGSKNDKAELLVDGRVIVGTVATITKLEQILGGTITLPGAKKSPSKKSPVKKAKSPARKKKSPARKSPVKKAKSPARKKKSPARKKKSPVKKVSPAKPRTSPKGKEEESPVPSPSKKKSPKKSPQTLDDVERRLDELIEEGGNVSEIDILKAKLAKLKAAKKSPTKPIAKPKPGKVQMKEQEIYKTFTGCLSALSAE